MILLAVEAEDTATISDWNTPRVRAAVQETVKVILALLGDNR